MASFKESVKYEVVIGVPDDLYLPKIGMTDFIDRIIDAWQQYAKEFYDSNDVYVSSIAILGKAIYNKDWGCPDHGERILSFHCTANPEFIKDLNKYEEGILYITKRLKRDFSQHTITITKLPADICYLTDEDNLEE